jgi:molybdate transport system substrate-binding protein
MRRCRPLAVGTGLVAALAALAGCGAGDDPASGVGRGSLTVFAAASLTESFSELGRQFQESHPGTKVTFSFGASSALAQQIRQGAPVDVFASASGANMRQVVDAGAADRPRDFATNRMRIAVPPDNPAGVSGLADLAGPGVTVALCAAEVPCGAAAREVFTDAGLTVTPVTNETDVKATLTKVQLGEVDAGLVYVTDVLAAGSKVKGIEIPDAVNASTNYPIAQLKAAEQPELAAEFVTFVLSPEGQKVLRAAGFGSP